MLAVCHPLFKFYLIQFSEPSKEIQRISRTGPENKTTEVGPAVNQRAFSGIYVLHQSLFTRGSVSWCHWAILGQVTLCSRTIISRNWEIQKSEMVRDWGRREDVVPSATQYRKRGVKQTPQTDKEQAIVLCKERVPIYLLENKRISTKTSFQDK